MVQPLHPEWFLLIPVLALVGWYWKGLKLTSPFRLLALALIITILVDPQIRQYKKGMDLWVLVDRSDSASAIVNQSINEWENLLKRAQPTADDELHMVNFAGEVVEQTGSETMKYAGNTGYTRSRLALEGAIGLLQPERHARVLMFTDGYSTEPMGDIGEKLLELNVPMDYRLLQGETATDYQIAAVNLPSRKRIGEPFLIEIVVRGNVEGKVEVLVARDDTEAQKMEANIVNGSARLQFATRVGLPGAHKYKVTLPVQDAYFGNNTFENWIEITKGPRVILVSKYVNDPVADMLRLQGFDVEVVSQPATLQVGQLTGAKVLIINNVPAYEIPGEFLSAVDFFVRRQGGGLLMAGGKYSFGAGGYYESPLDPLLPISMELKAEHRKLAVAMAIVLDRSGSMMATVPGGKTKMDLANEGSARAVELLGHNDFVTVFAVDSTAHEEVPLLQVGPNRGKITNRIRRIGSTGGGIFVYEGLSAGWNSLKKAEVGQRHLILFSDAADSEEPGTYEQLLAEMQKENTTVSVIGVGTRADVDAKLLEDIAKRGNGRIFFTDDATKLPNIFAQETVTVARSLYLDEPVATQATGLWLEISRTNFDFLGQVDGYNLSYARPEASVALISGDDYAAPLVASTQRGIGRTAAISFPLGGEGSNLVRGWDKMGDFVQTMTRWLMGETLPPGLGIRTNLDGTEFTLDLLHDETWVERMAQPPRIFLAETSNFDSVREVTWRRLAPGHFQATTQLEHGKMVRGAIQVGTQAVPFGPIVVGGSPEWSFNPTRIEELRQTSAKTGGGELVDLSKAWAKPKVKEFASIQVWLLTLLLGAVLSDALFTRMGWQIPVFAGWKRLMENLKPPAPRVRRTVVAEPKPDKKAAEEPVKATKEKDKPDKKDKDKKDPPPGGGGGEDDRRSRFDRAKRGR